MTPPTQYIYHLIDPRAGAVRYVGVSKNPYRRLRYHLSEIGRGDPLHEWLRELRLILLLPEVRTIKICGLDQYEDEREEIRARIAAGDDLVNTVHVRMKGKTTEQRMMDSLNGSRKVNEFQRRHGRWVKRTPYSIAKLVCFPDWTAEPAKRKRAK